MPAMKRRICIVGGGVSGLGAAWGLNHHPELFDFTVHATGATWPGVKDFHAYHEAIAQSMIAKGYCARFDGEEIVAKKENRFSEHFDVFLGEGFVRRGEGIYRSTCWPAAF